MFAIRAVQPSRARSGTIPIENVYYLLHYAWDALNPGDVIAVRPEQSLSLLDLYARVLVHAAAPLIRRGLAHEYQPRQLPVAGLRGKLDLGATIATLSLASGRTVCTVDVRGPDSPHNRVLKAGLRYLTTMSSLDGKLVAEARALLRQCEGVRDIPLGPAAFRELHEHRHIRQYDTVLNVCRLLYDNPFLDATPGQARFPEFTGQHADFARLFEQFIFTFYAREQRRYVVRRPIIAWHAASGDPRDVAHLPRMRTDVVLCAPDRQLIIDTKYYARPFQEYRGARTFHSDHLYQLFAYLRNYAAAPTASVLRSPRGRASVRPNAPLDGMLLYPAVGEPFHHEVFLHGHRVIVRSIDLDQPWRAIHDALLAAVDAE